MVRSCEEKTLKVCCTVCVHSHCSMLTLMKPLLWC